MVSTTLPPPALPEDSGSRTRLRESSRRRQRDRAAWQALAWGIMLFAVLQALFAFAAESWLPELRDPSFWVKARGFRQRLAATPNPPATVVMFGSSSTAFAFHGQTLEKELAKSLDRSVIAYNFGNYGRGPLTHLVSLQRLLREGVRPDLVLVEIFPYTLSETAPNQDKQGTQLQRGDVATVARYAKPGHIEQEWWRATVLPVSTNRATIVSSVLPKLYHWSRCPQWWPGADASGWLMPAGRDQPLDERAVPKLRDEWLAKWRDWRPGGQATTALEELLQLAQRENVSVALVVMPEGPLFRSLTPSVRYAEAFALVQGLSERYQTPLINAREWLPESDFSDSHHTTSHGAIAFTARLGRELSEPLAPRLTRSRNTGPAVDVILTSRPAP